MTCINYKGGYKYQLTTAYSVEISIKPENDIDFDYIVLSKQGSMFIKKGYAWDGPSGPTIDTLDFMRPSLVHDALYQLMREKQLDVDVYRKLADKLLQEMCKEDGMGSARAWIVYLAVRIVGKASATTPSLNQEMKAPKTCR